MLDISGLVPVIPTVNANITNTELDVDITDDPLIVSSDYDARMAALEIGDAVLSPGFNKSVFIYSYNNYRNRCNKRYCYGWRSYN